MFAKFAVLSKFCKCSNIETIGLRRIFQYDCGSKMSNRMVFTNCPTNAIIKLPLSNVSSTISRRYTRLNMSSSSNTEVLENVELINNPSSRAQNHSKRLERRKKLKSLKTSDMCCPQRSNIVPIATKNQHCLLIARNMSSSHKGDKGQSTESDDKEKKLKLESKRKYLRKLRFKGIKRPHTNCKRCKRNRKLQAIKTQNISIQKDNDLAAKKKKVVVLKSTNNEANAEPRLLSKKEKVNVLKSTSNQTLSESHALSKKEKANVLKSTSNQTLSESHALSKKVHVEFMESHNLKDFNINKSPRPAAVGNAAKQNTIDIKIKHKKPDPVQLISINVKKPIINLRTQNLEKSESRIGASKTLMRAAKADVNLKTEEKVVKNLSNTSTVKGNDKYKPSKPLMATPVVNTISLARGININHYLKLKSKSKAFALIIKHKLNKFAIQHNFEKYKALASKVLLRKIKAKQETISDNTNKTASISSDISGSKPSVNTSENILKLSALNEKPKDEEATLEANTKISLPVQKTSNLNKSDISKPSVASPIFRRHPLGREMQSNLKSKIKYKQKKLRSQRNQLKKDKTLASKTLIESSKLKKTSISQDAKEADGIEKSKSLLDVLVERQTQKLKPHPKTKLKLKPKMFTSKLKKKTATKIAKSQLKKINKDDANTEIITDKVKSDPKISDDKTLYDSDISGTKTAIGKSESISKPYLLLKEVQDESRKANADVQMTKPLENKPETSKENLLNNVTETILNSSIPKKFKVIINPSEDVMELPMETSNKPLIASDISGTKLSVDKSAVFLNEKVKDEKPTVETNKGNVLNNVTETILNSTKTEDVMNKKNISEKVKELPKKTLNKPLIGSDISGTKLSVDKSAVFLNEKVKDGKPTVEMNKGNVLNNVTETILNSTKTEDIMNKKNISEKVKELPKKNLNKPLIGSEISGTKLSVDKSAVFLNEKVKDGKPTVETNKGNVLNNVTETSLNLPKTEKFKVINLTEDVMNKKNVSEKVKELPKKTSNKPLIGSDISGTKLSIDKSAVFLNEKVKDGKPTVETNKGNVLNNVTETILNSTKPEKFKVIINPSEDVMDKKNVSEKVKELPKKTSNKPLISSDISGTKLSFDKSDRFLNKKAKDLKPTLEANTKIPPPVQATSNLNKTEKPIVTNQPLPKGIKSNRIFKLKSNTRLIKIKIKEKKLQIQRNLLEKWKATVSRTLLESSKLKKTSISKDANKANGMPKSKSLLDIAIERQNQKPESQAKPKPKLNLKDRMLKSKLQKKAKKLSKEIDQEVKQSTLENSKLSENNSVDKTPELKVTKKRNNIKTIYRQHPRRIKMLMAQREKLKEKSKKQLNPKEDSETLKQTSLNNASDEHSEPDVLTKSKVTLSTNRHILNVVGDKLGAKKDSPKTSELKNKINAAELSKRQHDQFIKKYVKAEEIKHLKLKEKVDAIKLRETLKKNKLIKQAVYDSDISGAKVSVDKLESIPNKYLSKKVEGEIGKADADVRMLEPLNNKSAVILKTNKLKKLNRIYKTRMRENISQDILKDKKATKETKKVNILNNVTDTILNSKNAKKLKIITNPYEDVMDKKNTSEKVEELPKKTSNKPLFGSDISGTKLSVDKSAVFLNEKVKDGNPTVETNKGNVLSNVTETILNSTKPEKFKVIINPSEDVMDKKNISEKVKELPKQASNKPLIGSDVSDSKSSIDNSDRFLNEKAKDLKATLEANSKIPRPLPKTSNLKKSELAKDASSSEKVKLVPNIAMVLTNNATTATKLKSSSNAEATPAKPKELKKLPNLHNRESFGHISKDVSDVLNEIKTEKLNPVKGQEMKESSFGNNYLTFPAKNSLDNSLELKVPKKSKAIRKLSRKIKTLSQQKMVKQTSLNNASDEHSEPDVPTKSALEVKLGAKKDSPKTSELENKIDAAELSQRQHDQFIKKYLKVEEIKHLKLKEKVNAIMLRKTLKKNKLINQGVQSLRRNKILKSIRTRIGGSISGSSRGGGGGDRFGGQENSENESSSSFWSTLSLTVMPFLVALTIYIMSNTASIKMFKRMKNKKPKEEKLSGRLIPANYENTSQTKQFDLNETDSEKDDNVDDKA